MKVWVSISWVLTTVVLLVSPVHPQDLKNILVLQMETTRLPATVVAANAIRETLEKDSRNQVFEEYMDESRLGSDHQALEDTLRSRYGGTRMDLILTVGQPTFRFLIERGDKLWPNTPKVFSMVDIRIVPRKLPPKVTGVASRLNFASTLDLALSLQPNLAHVFYVGGVSTADLIRRQLAEQELKPYAARLDLSYLQDTSLPPLLERLQHLPLDSAVIFAGIPQNAAGVTQVPARICSTIVNASTAPVYGLHQTLLGCGIVGGSLFDIEGNAAQAGNLAMRILNGESMERLPVEAGPAGKLAIDWRQLRRWNIPKTRVPAAATIIFREDDLWQQYRKYLLIGLGILGVQAILVILLIIQMLRRKRSDEAIRRLTGRVINAAEDERKHIARELHDDIGQRLSLISMQLDSVLARTPLPPDGEPEMIDVHRELDALITDVHDLSHRLHSTKLEHLGLKLALKDLCHRVSRQHTLHVDFSAPAVLQTLPGDVALCFYRVAQEGLSNVVRHSGSPSVEVRLEEGAGRVRMQIKDFGIGFDPGPNSEGLGLATMQERLRTVGGKFSVVSRRGEGTVLTAEARLHASSRAA